MKTLILFTIVTAMLAFATGKAAAQISFTGVGAFIKPPTTNGSSVIATTVKMSYSNTFVDNLISNGVIHASNSSNGLPATLPAGCYIVYNPELNDGKYQGLCYLANKTGYTFALSGYDANNDYYSFMKLNTHDYWLGTLGLTNDDCCCDEGYTYTYNYNKTTGSGTYSAIDIASLMIRSDPYGNQSNDVNSIRLEGLFKPSLSFKNSIMVSPSTAIFTGTGKIDYGNATYFQTGVVQFAQIKYNF